MIQYTDFRNARLSAAITSEERILMLAEIYDPLNIDRYKVLSPDETKELHARWKTLDLYERRQAAKAHEAHQKAIDEMLDDGTRHSLND